MKVRDLIKDTDWRPGRDYGGPRPVVSVLLPTFRRGADGLFMKAARSVLNQTLRDLELIIIDDASTDGTADQIRDLMKADGRVSCLTHPSNIGLPAVSEYEGFVRSRGEYLAFAFDDFVFEKDAIAALVEQARSYPDSLIHGYVEWYDQHRRRHSLGRDVATHELLKFYNFLGNSSFIVARSLIDEVGLYDPHVTSARLCDWDLWLRVMREYPIRSVPVFVGTEHGPARTDSLCNSYPLHPESLPEYFGAPRNYRLRPDAFEDFDVWDLPEECSSLLAAQILTMREFFKSKAWAANAMVIGEAERQTLFSPVKRVIGIFSFVEPALSMGLAALHDEMPSTVMFIAPDLGDALLQFYFAKCDSVIISRYLYHAWSQKAIFLCAAMNVPLYYYVDENFVMLSNQPEYAACNIDAFSSTLKKFKGVLVATPALRDYFEMFKLHSSIRVLRPAFSNATAARMARIAAASRSPVLRIGFIGVDSRVPRLRDSVLPALAAISEDTELELVSRVNPGELHGRGFEVKHVGWMAFDEFLTEWRRLRPDILVHPCDESLARDYKGPTFLLISCYLGALPIVSKDRVYRDMGEGDGVLVVDGSAASWEAAIRRARDPEFRDAMQRRLVEFCRREFAVADCLGVVEEIIADTAPTDMLTWAERVRQLAISGVGAGGAQDHERLIAELNSRTYRFALVLRRPVTMMRSLMNRIGIRLRLRESRLT